MAASTDRSSTDRLRKLQSIADAALAHLELDELLNELLLRIRDAVDADTCAVLLLDERRNELVARAARGLEEEVEQGIRIPVGRGFAGKIAAERRPVSIDDVDHADILNPILREKGIKSLLGVPLLSRGGVVGVLHVGTLTPRSFTADDVELLELAAERASLAIEHARVFAAERGVTERLRKLELVTDAALSHLGLDALLAELVDRVRTILATDTCAVLLLDEERDELVARAARGLEEEVEQGVRIPVGRGFAGRIAAERRPIAIEDVDRADIVNPILREKGLKSLLGAPLLARGRVLGVIHVGTLTPRIFTHDEVDLLQVAAERAALGVERALVHEELIRLDRVRHAFVSIASHELRTPTSAILGAALTLVRRRDELDPQQVLQLEDILASQAERLANLIEQLLDLSRLEAQAVEIRPEAVRIRERLEQIVDGLADDRRQEITIDAPPDLEIRADPLALERVVSNLIVNALRHGAPPIVVSAEKADRHVRVTVDDSGEGVPPDVRPRLFEQFSRSAAAAGTTGTGLGLAIARSYAQAHGGDVIYDSSRSGGARFQLVLPMINGE